MGFEVFIIFIYLFSKQFVVLLTIFDYNKHSACFVQKERDGFLT